MLFRSGSYYSNYFDGSGDYLTVSNNAAFQFGTGDFTVEFWLNSTDSAFNIVGLNTGGAGNWMAVVLSDYIYWQNEYAQTNLFSTNAASILDGKWHHVAFTRLSGVTRVYFDGVSQTSASDSLDPAGIIEAELALDDFDVAGKADQRLATVAARGAPAHFTRFEHRDEIGRAHV